MRRGWIAVLAALSLLAGCGRAPVGDSGRVSVVATTPIIADLARHVAGQRAEVTSLVPSGADPHTHEPSLRDVRRVAHASVTLSNGLMLEPHALVRTVEESRSPGAVSVTLAEEAQRYGAEYIPLVEDARLDTVWLGMRVIGTGAARGADRTSTVHLRLTGAQGPGDVTAYVTGTFGRPRIHASTSDGIDARDDTELPTDAHTHMSWAFTRPGVHRLSWSARLDTPTGPVELAPATLTVAVGADPRGIPELAGRTVVERGHADLAANLDTGRVELAVDPAPGSRGATRHLDPSRAVVWVPPKALSEIPPSPHFRFLGRPGTQIHQLPQAVLGAHVHGEVDPHLWMSVPHAKAYAQVIRDALTRADPAGAEVYARNTRAHLAELDRTDRYVQRRMASIPASRRHLVTTHDGYGYFARRYGLSVAGFVTASPGVEPSVGQRRKLDRTLADLGVPAVFLEPTVLRQSSVLASLADDRGMRVCPIRAETLDSSVPTYVDLMRFDADSLARCLG